MRFRTYIRLFPRTGGTSVSMRSQSEGSGVDHDDEHVTPATPAETASAPGSSDVERMMPLVYEELRRIARRQLRHEGVGHTFTRRICAWRHLRISMWEGARSFSPSPRWRCAEC